MTSPIAKVKFESKQKGKAVGDVILRIIRSVFSNIYGLVGFIAGLIAIGTALYKLIENRIKKRRSKPGKAVKTNVGFDKVKKAGDSIWKKPPWNQNNRDDNSKN